MIGRCAARWLLLGIVPALATLIPVGPIRAGADDSSQEEVLALVDGDTISVYDLQAELQVMRARGQRELPSAEGILKRLIQNRLFEQEGYRVDAHLTPEVKRQTLDLIRHRSMRALLDSVSADARAWDPPDLDEELNRTSRMERIAHILVPEEQQARALLDSLSAGADFAALAIRHSQDTLSASRGGEMGWAREGVYVDAFSSALAELEAGEYGGPVKTDFGWHLLKLQERRTETVGQSDPMRKAMRETLVRDSVTTVVRNYVSSLKEKYEVAVDSTLLATLDYATSDSGVYEELRNGTAVLAELPWRDLTVAGLTRQIRFKHFHGLEGNTEAAEIRDKMFDEWVTENLLRHEAGELGFDQRPEIAREAQHLERELVREATINHLLSYPFEPSEEEISAFYQDHLQSFRPSPEIRARGVVFASEADAQQFRSNREAGAAFNWLLDRAAGIIDPDPPGVNDWLTKEVLKSTGQETAPGLLVGPLPAEAGWGLAEVAAVEIAEPIPLAKCRPQVLRAMKQVSDREVLRRGLDRLEEAAEIEIRPGTPEVIEQRVAEWGLAVGTVQATPSP